MSKDYVNDMVPFGFGTIEFFSKGAHGELHLVRCSAQGTVSWLKIEQDKGYMVFESMEEVEALEEEYKMHTAKAEKQIADGLVALADRLVKGKAK